MILIDIFSIEQIRNLVKEIVLIKNYKVILFLFIFTSLD